MVGYAESAAKADVEAEPEAKPKPAPKAPAPKHKVNKKPVKGGTTARNPGCPNCGYVGWIEVEVTVRVGRGADDARRMPA